MRTLWGPDGARYITRVGDRALHEVHAILDGVALIDGALYEAAPARYLSDPADAVAGLRLGAVAPQH